MANDARPLAINANHPNELLGLLVSALAVAVVTALIYPLKSVAPAVSTGVLYLLAVLLISTYWGLRLGILTAILSALAFNWFHIPPTGHLGIADPQNWVALGVYIVVATVVSTLVDAGRKRALEAEEHRRAADLSADLARTVLGSADIAESLPRAGQLIADALELERTEIVLGWAESDRLRRAIPLVDAGERVGTLLVPTGISTLQQTQLNARVIPALTAIVAAARQRVVLEALSVETKALRRSDELKTALLRTVSHDLRSPLTAIATAISGVRSRTASPADRDEMAALIATEVDRLSRLVENLLDLSRLETGTALPDRHPCSIEEVVEAAIDGLSTPNAPIDIVLDTDLPAVNVDTAQLERAVGNLLENAIRHSNGAGVAVRARVNQGRLLLRVIDHGPGIEKHALRTIFEPFYRVEDASGGASGLGLAIAKGFVEANDGRIWAQSLRGQGSTFTIELPVDAQPTEGRT
jgi:two-component system sensor histidine kinase KdpD